MKKIMTVAGIAVAATALATPAAAKTATLDCQLKQIIRKAGDAEAQNLQLTLKLDFDTGKAQILSEDNASELKVIRGNQATTFMQLFPSGEVRTTTVSNQGRAAHTRHGVERGEIVPTLYHGNCR